MDGFRRGARLGVDVGSVRVGVATCDPDGILATPVTTLPAGADPVGELVGLVHAHDVVEVVVGLPRSLSGEEGPAAQTARVFARRLAESIRPVPVRLVDERLTTVDAHRALRASGRDERNSRTVIDQVAAVLILQAALEAEHTSGRPPGEVVGGRKPRRRGGTPQDVAR